jgi:arginyl-tRNA synthetase
MPLMNLQETLSNQVKKAVKTIFNADLDMVEFQATRKDFAGDLTVVVFPILKVVKGNPQSIGEQIGDFLVANVEEVKAYNVIKGFLNIEIEDTFYINFFNEIKTDDTF